MIINSFSYKIKIHKILSKHYTFDQFSLFGVLVFVNRSNCQHEGPGTIGEMPSMGVFQREPSPYLHKFQRKTTENSEWLSQQAWQGIEHGTSCLSVLRVKPFGH